MEFRSYFPATFSRSNSIARSENAGGRKSFPPTRPPARNSSNFPQTQQRTIPVLVLSTPWDARLRPEASAAVGFGHQSHTPRQEECESAHAGLRNSNWSRYV